jgi:adenosylcobalamin-dependent ribonucleoside-diphosphate reductase
MAIAPHRVGLGLRRHFTTEGVHPYDEVRWERRDSRIVNYRDGSVAFEQLGVEVPEGWSQNATNILAQKYFRGTLGTPEREWSLRQVADRVVDTLTAWGMKDGYFVDDAEAEIFRDELKHLIIHQKAAFNSPVWFNIGVEGVPQQGSACQPYDALVSTPEGLVPIGRLVEDEAVGAKVLDAHGITRIVAVKHNGRKEVLRVRTTSGHVLDVTADHLVWRCSEQHSTVGDFVETAELVPGDLLQWHEDDRLGTVAIDTIDVLGEMDVYDIQTESGEYLSASLRVHNCFILSVEDSMDSILNWYTEEGIIFKGGSGAGVNLSKIRSSNELLKGGGTASGPVSFMRGADASAGTIKSGGKTRRAAKMVILDADHPDIEDFIWCKAIEERKARVLAAAGFDMDLDGADSHSTQYQNANNSVRVTDEFMEAVLDGRDWELTARTDGSVVRTVPARDLFRQIAHAAWECADPGMQFDTTINKWHTAPNTGRINGSNPCSEYMHLDNSACNLASLNLMKFLKDDGTFDVAGFKAAIEVVFTGQEIIVGNADYPTEKIAENSRRFRELGLGYANLGALLMANGLPYDSDAGRAWAAAITALMTGHAYATSARTAARMGPFAGFHENAEPMVGVLRMHQGEAAHIDEELVPPELLSAAQEAWDEAVELAEQYGVRNSQASVLAPTGCLVGGTLVSTGRGLVRLHSLGDPDGEKWQDLETVVATDEGPRRATRFFVNGAEPVVTVETHRGYRICGTTTHRVKVVDVDTGAFEWRRFADLQPGDLVPLALGSLVGEPQEVALPPLGDAGGAGEDHLEVPRSMTPALAELVGYFMGEGSLRRGLRLCVDAGDFDVIERLCQLGKECFGLEAATVAQSGCTEVRLDSPRLVSWWEDCGFAKHAPASCHVGAGDRAHVPDAILHSNDREVYAAFLRGLLEANGDTTGGYPTLRSTSLELVRDVQSLLLAMGIPAALGVDDRAGPSWGRAARARLRVLDLDCNRAFMDEIGFIGGRKNAAVAVGTGQQIDHHDWIPVPRDLVDRLAAANQRLHPVLLHETVRGRMSRRLANELFERTGEAELGHLLGFYYDQVSSATLGEDELTYDLSVPENVTYVANGFVSHNTIGLLMDCDTTGVEPDLGLVKTKKLVGGGTMSIVNQTVPRALGQLGYSPSEIDDIIAYIDEHKSIVGAPHFRSEHLPVFACSMGDNAIHYSGHVRMMGAVQPFISGAISKCVTGDTLVASEDGLVRLGRLYEGEVPDSFRPERMLVASIGGPQKTDAFYYGGERPVRRVVLRSGHALTGTPNHRLMVAGDGELTWKRLDEIEVGDEVATQYGSDLWAPLPARLAVMPGGPSAGQEEARLPQEMTEDLAFLLGAYASQGCSSRSTGTVRIACAADSVLERVAAAVRSTFGIEPSVGCPTAGCPFVEISSKTVVQLLEQLGCGPSASAKRIPDALLRSTRRHVLAFLQGLALGAHVTESPTGAWSIRLGSPALLDDLQVVLNNLGVVHSRTAKLDAGDGTTYHEVHATGVHAQTIARLVPFLEPEKAAAARRLLARSCTQGTSDVVPGITGPELYQLLPEGRRSRFGHLLAGRARQVSRTSLERVAAVEGVVLPPWLRTVLEDGLYFSPVTEVADAGLRTVYDLSVPSTHAFVGNGIVNHNTVNMPEDVTVEDIEQLHIDAWKLGIKAVAIYRDNCKVAQPLSTTKMEGGDAMPPGSEAEAKDRRAAERIAELEAALTHERQRRSEPLVVGAVRERLPRRRRSKTFAFRVADCEGYVTVGEYEDGRPGEVFIKVSKQGSTLAGIMDAFSISISLGLQHGVPLATYVRKYTNLKFEPAGITDDPDLRIATSLVDYIFRRLALDYLGYEDRLELGVLSSSERIQPTLPGVEESATESRGVVDDTMAAALLVPRTAAGDAGSTLARAEARDAPFCYNCGDVMQRAGSCYVCTSCGSTSGCS